MYMAVNILMESCILVMLLWSINSIFSVTMVKNLVNKLLSEMTVILVLPQGSSSLMSVLSIVKRASYFIAKCTVLP